MSPYKAGALFALFLLALFIFFICVIAMNAGPIVLGSELNGNGTTEYLCLGRGCENL